MSSIYDWSTTEANNGNSDSGINWLEGQLPSTVNNSARYMMRRGKELLNDLGFVATTGGTANTITLTASSPFTAYADGMFVTFRAALDNTGAATLNVNSVGAKNIYKQSITGNPALVGGEIQAGALYRLAYVAALNAAAGGWMIVETSKEHVTRGHLYGLTLSNNSGDATNDIDIAVGECASDSGSPILMTLGTAITKRLDAAWAVGSGNGGLDTGSIANTTYHVWLIQRSDTGVVDALFSTSATSPTMPTNYDRKRRIGSILRVSGAILGFSQNGDDFLIKVPTINYTSGVLSTTAISQAMNVPVGIVVDAKLNGYMQHASNSTAATLISSLDQTDNAADATNFSVIAQVVNIASAFTQNVRTNTSGQVRIRGSTANITISITTYGWVDTRGRV